MIGQRKSMKNKESERARECKSERERESRSCGESFVSLSVVACACCVRV